GRSTLTLYGITDTDAHGVIGAGAKGTGTTGAYPLVATGVALLLLLVALLELLDQLVEPTQGLDLGLFLVGEQALELLAQPVLRDQRLEQLVEVLQAIEIGGEGAVELVEMTLVLDHHGAGQIVELVHIGKHHVVF